ncbi:MAG: hypothetical protein CMP07_10075 [Xanthomonadales bacterium]|nr:hypothetical protein [Xanthomonadales bacterium]
MRSFLFAILVVPAIGAAETRGPIVTPATFTVNSVADSPDLVLDGVCDAGATRGGVTACTLRAAIQEANFNPGSDTIEFDIPGCPDDICVIDIVTAGGNFLPDIQSPVVIDGSTQPGNADVCELDIPQRSPYRVVLDGDGQDIGMRLEAGSDGSVIRGLNFRNFTNAVQISRSDQSRVECNFIGTDEPGTMAAPNNAGNGVFFQCEGTGNIVGGTGLGDGNLISGHAVDGVQFFGGADCSPTAGNIPSGNSVLGNFIGTARDGVTPLGNDFAGVSFFGAPGADGNFVGVLPDGATVRGNVIGANGTSGILIDGDAASTEGTDGTVVMGNFLGTDRSGTVDLGNFFGGVDIVRGDDNLVGGGSPGMANVIAFNAEGVYIEQDAGTGNRIQQNRFYDNIGLGIELIDATGELGATPNDPGDTDTGANQLQNWPELFSAEEDGGVLSIGYAVDAATLPIRVEFFVADDDGTEGARFIGAHEYTVAGSAVAAISADPVEIGDRVLATATDAEGNTSEFSPSIAAVFLDRLFRDGFE